MTLIDYLVVGAYLVGITAFGSWLGRFHRTTADYFLTGRSVPGWAICCTTVATETSTLSFIGVPAAAYAGDFGVPAARRRVHPRARHRRAAAGAGLLRRRSADLLRPAAAAFRAGGQEPQRRAVHRHALARRRHPPVCDGAGDRGGDGRPGLRGRRRPRPGDDRLHDARRRLGRHLDRRDPAVRLPPRRRHPRRVAAGAHPRRLGRRRRRRQGRRQVRGRRCRLESEQDLHAVVRADRRHGADPRRPGHRSVLRAASARGAVARRCGVGRVRERPGRVRASSPCSC